MYYSKETIRFNYNKAISKARELDELAQRLENLAKRDMNDTLTAVSQGWKGDNSDLFAAKGRKARDDMIECAKQLRRLAAAIRTAAEKVRAAEERAREIALRKSGGGGYSAGGGGYSSRGGGSGAFGSGSIGTR